VASSASLVAVALAHAAADLASLEQKALDDAADAVADSVVQIQTVGGMEQLEGQALAQGPTTGLIITADGYMVSSAFNFAQEPTSILVRLPDGSQRPANMIGHDASRMLVLLKVDADKPLPAPKAAPLDEVHVGDWAIALGRTYSAKKASVSVGVISAVNRMHGRAVQTDANVSAANYGGPLVDIRGRVIGVLAPMSPQPSAGGETSAIAGSEYYDSGIGFAVPLTHVLSVLDRWKKEKELKRGILGVGLKPGNSHSTPPVVSSVRPRSPVAAAGWQPKDRIVAVNGVKVASQTDLRFQVLPHYAGDTLKVTLRRGKGKTAKELETEVTLVDKLPTFRHAFLGVLPERNASIADAANVDAGEEQESDEKGEEDEHAEADQEKSKPAESATGGVVIRAVWPGSPAEKAKLQPGDHIVQLGEEKIATLAQALSTLNAKNPGDELAVTIERGDEKIEHKVKLAELPVEPLSASDYPDHDNQSEPAADAGELKLEELKLLEMKQTARYYQPADDKRPLGLLVWLSDGKEATAKALADAWQVACRRDGLVLLMPEPADAAGWTNDDLEYLARLLQTALGRFNVDPRRIVIAGEGKAGQLAYALSFQGRRLIRGVAVVDSPLPRTLELPENTANERLAVLSVETQNTPLSLLIRQDLQKIQKAGYPAAQIVRRGEASRESALDATTRGTIARWIDGLDRL
jgi:serine protease Do